jgi:hypothetical protein
MVYAFGVIDKLAGMEFFIWWGTRLMYEPVGRTCIGIWIARSLWQEPSVEYKTG